MPDNSPAEVVAVSATPCRFTRCHTSTAVVSLNWGISYAHAPFQLGRLALFTAHDYKKPLYKRRAIVVQTGVLYEYHAIIYAHADMRARARTIDRAIGTDLSLEIIERSANLN